MYTCSWQELDEGQQKSPTELLPVCGGGPLKTQLLPFVFREGIRVSL